MHYLKCDATYVIYIYTCAHNCMFVCYVESEWVKTGYETDRILWRNDALILMHSDVCLSLMWDCLVMGDNKTLYEVRTFASLFLQHLKCDTIYISMFVLYAVLKLTYCD